MILARKRDLEPSERKNIKGKARGQLENNIVYAGSLAVLA